MTTDATARAPSDNATVGSGDGLTRYEDYRAHRARYEDENEQLRTRVRDLEAALRDTQKEVTRLLDDYHELGLDYDALRHRLARGALDPRQGPSK